MHFNNSVKACFFFYVEEKSSRTTLTGNFQSISLGCFSNRGLKCTSFLPSGYFWTIYWRSCTLFLSLLAFFQEFSSGGRIYRYANFFCYANCFIVFGPNLRGQKSSRGKLPQGAAPFPPHGRKPDYNVLF